MFPKLIQNIIQTLRILHTATIKMLKRTWGSLSGDASSKDELVNKILKASEAPS